MLDSLVRVSRRAADNHYAIILAEARTSPQPRCITRGYNTPPRGRLHSQGLIQRAKTMMASRQRVDRSEDRWNTAAKS